MNRFIINRWIIKVKDTTSPETYSFKKSKRDSCIFGLFLWLLRLFSKRTSEGSSSRISSWRRNSALQSNTSSACETYPCTRKCMTCVYILQSKFAKHKKILFYFFIFRIVLHTIHKFSSKSMVIQYNTYISD